VDKAQYTLQRWHKQAAFPSDFIEQGWAENFNITTIAYGAGEWVVVMSQNAERCNEIWASRKSFNEITAIIKENWKSKDIISVAYGNGEWVVVMAECVAYDKQVYKHGETFPSDWVREKYDTGYNITSVAYGEGQWFVVMSKLPVQKNERYNLSPNFPAQYIKSGWTTNQRLSILFFNGN